MLIDDHVAALREGRAPWAMASDPAAAMLPGLEAAVVYDVSDEVVELANAVTWGDLPGLERTLDLARPPHPVTWFEYSALTRRSWLEMRGMEVAPTWAWPRRSGVLVVEEGRLARLTNVNCNPKPDETIGPVGVHVDFAREGPPPEGAGRNGVDPDPGYGAAEVAAHRAVTSRMAFGPSPYAGWFPEGRLVGPAAERAWVGWCEDILPEVIVTLGFCLVLAVPGMVETAPSDLSRLNRALARSGKPTKREHVTVRVARDFRREARLLVESHDRRPGATRPHIVRGHFKRVAKGLAWWNSHVRGGAAGDGPVGGARRSARP